VSGEVTLQDQRVDSIALEPITVLPVAQGLTLAPTTTIGAEGEIIPLNLNNAMADPLDQSTPTAPDSSQEKVAVRISGLGEHTAFYVGNVLIHNHPTITEGPGVYLVSGLNQIELDQLGFVQAQGAVDGVLDIEAWTYETGDPNEMSDVETTTVTVQVSQRSATTGNDRLIFSGDEIDGLGGVDEVFLRYGESVDGEDLANLLTNVERIDLSIAGENEINGLTPDHVQAIVGSGGTTLTIKGTEDDKITLDGEWVYDADNDRWVGTVPVTGDNPSGEVILKTEGNVAVVDSPSMFGMGVFSLPLWGAGATGDVEDGADTLTGWDDDTDAFLFGIGGEDGPSADELFEQDGDEGEIVLLGESEGGDGSGDPVEAATTPTGQMWPPSCRRHRSSTRTR
jgi:hypothetical protein